MAKNKSRTIISGLDGLTATDILNAVSEEVQKKNREQLQKNRANYKNKVQARRERTHKLIVLGGVVEKYFKVNGNEKLFEHFVKVLINGDLDYWQSWLASEKANYERERATATTELSPAP